MTVCRSSRNQDRHSLLGALLLGLGLCASPEASASAPASPVALDPSRTAALTRVRIQHQIDTVELYKREGRWWVADRDVPARADMVLQTLRQLEALAAHPVRTLGKKESLEPYGLHVEAARFVRLQFADGKIVRLRLGVRPDEKNAIYWARDVGDPLSVKTPPPREILRGAGFLIATSLDSWISPLLIDTTITRDLKTLRVEWLDSTGRPVRYALEREPGTGRLVLTDPRDLQANPVKAAEAFAQVGTLLIDGFPEGGEGASPGAEPAGRVRVTVEDKNGRSVTLAPEFSDDFHDYVRHPQAPEVLVKMRRVQFDSFRHTPLFLATSYPYGPEEDDGISGPPPPHFAVWAPHTHDHYYDPEDPDAHEHHDHGDHEDERGHDHGHDHEQGGHGQPQDTSSGVKAKAGHEGHRH